MLLNNVFYPSWPARGILIRVSARHVIDSGFRQYVAPGAFRAHCPPPTPRCSSGDTLGPRLMDQTPAPAASPQRGAQGPGSPAPPGSLLEMQTRRPHSRPAGRKLYFNKTPRRFLCTRALLQAGSIWTARVAGRQPTSSIRPWCLMDPRALHTDLQWW